jgi:hypothetical protein
MPPENHELVAHRLANLERNTAEMAVAVKSMAESLSILATLEVKHEETREALGRCFTEIKNSKAEQAVVNKDIETRTKAIEVEMPMTKMVRGWNIAGVTGVFVLVALAIVALVIK